MEFLQKLIGMLGSNALDALIYAIIVLVFIIGLIYCIKPVLDNRGRLRRGVTKMKNAGEKQYPWQADDFLGRGSLSAHWSAYLDNLFFAEGNYHNPSNVEDFINEETVIYGPGRSAFADAVPSLLVSLGFLGTLLGLAQGLSGFDMTDSAAAQESIMVLIPGMKYAFTTSIFGVVGSVLFTLITRAVYGSTEHTLRSFYGAMSRYAGVYSVDPLTQVAIYQQEQTALIQTMARDLNGAFTENMAQAFKDAVEPVNQSIKNFMTVTSKEQMRFLDAVVVRFVERMDAVIGGKLHDFGQMLERTTRGQEEAFEAIRAGMTESEAAVRDLRAVQMLSKEMTKTMSGYLEDLRASQQQSQAGFEKISGAVEQMELVSRQQTAYLKTVSAMQTEVARSVENMTNTVNGFTRRFSEENAAAAQAMQKASVELREASAHFENIQQSAVKAMENELKSTLESYQDYVNQFTQRVDYLASGISESLSQMPKAVGETADQFLDQVDRLTQVLEQAQHALNEAVDRFYEGQ